MKKKDSKKLKIIFTMLFIIKDRGYKQFRKLIMNGFQKYRCFKNQEYGMQSYM